MLKVKLAATALHELHRHSWNHCIQPDQKDTIVCIYDRAGVQKMLVLFSSMDMFRAEKHHFTLLIIDTM